MEKLPRSPIASQVNDFDFLMKRVRRCRQLRDALPNIVAVDYYNKGDVVDLAQELNAIPGDKKPSYCTD